MGKGDWEVALRRKPFAILEFLTANPRRLVTRDEVVGAVWGHIAMSESLLRTYISEVRRGLGEGTIETVVGRGYRFLLEVQQEASTSSRADIVGREREMALLHQAFDAALHERKRQVVVLTGDAGIGKTTLVDAFVARMAAPGALVVRGWCVEQTGVVEPFFSVLAALNAACRSSRGAQLIEAVGPHAPTGVRQNAGPLGAEKPRK